MGIFDYNSPVILTFSLLSLAALGLNYLTKGESNVLIFSVYKSSFSDPLTYLRFFTHVLGHSNFSHLASNISFLLVVGPMVEEKYGSKPLLISIISTAFVTGFFHVIVDPNSMLLGSSGILFMVILMASVSSIKNGTLPITLVLVAVIYIGGEITNGLLITDQTSQLAHVTGGVMGIMCGLIIRKN